MVLPRLISLQSTFNDGYLTFLDKDEQGRILSTGEKVTSPMSKFAIEPAEGSTTLVHIRCCYNNKYLCKINDKDPWVVATAAKQDIDQEKYTCTLFEPVMSSSDPYHIMYFRHAKKYNNEYLSVWIKKDTRLGFLSITTRVPADSSSCAWEVIDLEALLILPKFIAFSNVNEKFLNASPGGSGFYYIKFTGKEVGNLGVGNTLSINKDGSISIKSCQANKFWGCGRYEYIIAEEDSGESEKCRFWPVLIDIDTKVIALRTMSSKKFCYGQELLYCNKNHITKETYLVVTELVISRMVYGVDYRLPDIRKYNEVLVTMATGVADNQTDKSAIVGITLKYTVETTTYWSNSIMGKLGVTASITAGIPMVGDVSTEVSAEVSGSYQWGGNVNNKDELETDYQVVVPPHTRVNVSLLATKCSFELPFSYLQRDTLWNGKHIITRGNDGVYKGDCCYGFTYKSEKADLKNLTQLFNHIPIID